MSEKEIISIADNADMIINGFSFTINEDGFIRVLNLNNTDEACLLNKDGEMIEAAMDDEVLFKVQAYYAQNKELMEEE
jgi:hypothetical protein